MKFRAKVRSVHDELLPVVKELVEQEELIREDKMLISRAVALAEFLQHGIENKTVIYDLSWLRILFDRAGISIPEELQRWFK